MMKFMVAATIKQDTSVEDLQRLAPAEGKAVWDFHKRGILQTIFHRADVRGAVSILECSSKEELQSELRKLPLYQHMNVEIFPLRPYEGYEAIWTGQ
jgi:muconolactone delta-isomerase